MNQNFLKSIFFCVLLIFSCSSEDLYDKFSASSDLAQEHFNGISIGDSVQVVLESINDSLLVQNNNELLFSSSSTDERIAKRKIRTALDREKIYEITVDFYLKSDSMIQPFFLECKKALDDIYGESGMDDGYANWRSASVHKKVIEIELFDESINSDLRMVSINFYEDFDKSFYAE